MDNDLLFVAFIVVCSLCMFFLFAVGIQNDKIDMFGETFCAEHGFSYESYKYNKDTGLKFFCRNETETKVEDGYLVVR